VSNKIYPVFTAWCCTERGIATAIRLSISLSVYPWRCGTRYHDHIGWNSSGKISHLVSLGCSLSI